MAYIRWFLARKCPLDIRRWPRVNTHTGAYMLHIGVAAVDHDPAWGSPTCILP